MQRDAALGLDADPRLALGEFVLDLARGELLDAQGRPAGLRAQALRLLLVLGELAGQVVSKDELMRRVWGEVVVTEDSLVQAIGDIRRLLGPAGHELLRTVPRRGYLLNLVPAGETTAAPLHGPPQAAAARAAETPSTTAAPPALASAAPAGTRHRRAWTVAGAALAGVVLLLLALGATQWP